MRMEQLRCLVDIAETKSISATAERLYINQQTLSKSMKQLEEELGAELLVRTNRGVQLTAIGEEVLAYAQQMVDTESAMRNICEHFVKPVKEQIEIRIISASAVTNIVLPDIVAKLNVREKNIKFKVDLATDIDELFCKVASGAYDLGLLTYNDTALQEKFQPWQTDLQMDILAMDEMVAVTDSKFIKDGAEQFPLDEYFKHIRTVYNILPADELKTITSQNNMAIFGDADFHRKMIEKAGAVVVMSGISYRNLFHSKKYIGLPLSSHSAALVHAALYHKDTDVELQKLISMIRRELYIQ